MTRTERTYYLVFGLYTLWAWFIAPVYPLFLRSRGLDALEVNLVLAIYLIVVFAFEVPTGAAADLLGRKTSFLLACAVRALAFGLYAVAHDFADCAVAEMIDGVGTTLASGALDAWAVDGMRADGGERPVDRFFARAQMLARVMMILGGLACAYLAAVDFSLPWWVATAGFASTGAIALWRMHEVPRAVMAAATRPSLVAAMRDGFRSVRTAPVLGLVCALTGASFFAAIPAHMLWQQRMIDLSAEGVWIIGWLWVLLNLAAVAGSALLPRLLERLRREWVLFLSAAWRGVALGFAALATTFAPALGGWLLQEVSFGFSEPVVQAWMNEDVAAERRATVLSIRSMIGTLGRGRWTRRDRLCRARLWDPRGVVAFGRALPRERPGVSPPRPVCGCEGRGGSPRRADRDHRGADAGRLMSSRISHESRPARQGKSRLVRLWSQVTTRGAS